MIRPCFVVQWFLIWFFLTCSAAYEGHLIKAVEDSVGAENFTYYTYSDPGPLLLVLESLSGDADLYVSDSYRKPTYTDYTYKSNTCGMDTLDLSQLKRPIYIGVFGSHAYETTEYILYAYRPTSKSSNFENEENTESESAQVDESAATSSDTEDSSSMWPFFEFLLHVLEFLIQAIL